MNGLDRLPKALQIVICILSAVIAGQLAKALVALVAQSL